MSIREQVRHTKFESDAQEAMVSLLVAAAHVQRALADVCAAHGITHDQYNVLRILRGVHPAGYPRYEIAGRLMDRSPDVTRLLDRLERQALVERSRSPEDRRLSLSLISRKGLTLLARMDPEVREVHEHSAAGLSKKDRTQLVRLCELVVP